MKKMIFIFLALSQAGLSFAQKVHTERIFSKSLNDTVEFRVSVPENWSKNILYQSIYTVEDAEDEILATNVEFYRSFIPKTIVIGIVNGRGLIKYSYLTGKLDPKGAEFIESLKHEIIPFVEKKYHTSAFRAFMGHSYSATYANYLLTHYHGLFSGYILFSPEKWGIPENKPAFTLDSLSMEFYNHHKTFYYLSVGGKDLQRRIDYCQEVAEKLKALDANQFLFTYQIFPQANHITNVPNSIPTALEHIFKPYCQFLYPDTVTDAKSFFNKTQKDIKELYGLEMEKSNVNMSILIEQSSKSKDEKALQNIEHYFVDEKTKAFDIIYMAEQYEKIGNKNKAKELLYRSIENAKKDTDNTTQASNCLVMAYNDIAFKIYKDENESAWKVLSEALLDKSVKDPVINYYLGKLSAERGFNSKKGIEHLLIYNQYYIEQGKANWNIKSEEVYLNLAKCYYQLKDKKNCKIQAEKALQANPENEEAKQLLEKI